MSWNDDVKKRIGVLERELEDKELNEKAREKYEREKEGLEYLIGKDKAESNKNKK